MTPEQLAEIKARRAAASAPGTSMHEKVNGEYFMAWAVYRVHLGEDAGIISERMKADAAFIASAPADIDALIAEVERLHAENDAMRHDLHVTDGLYAMDKPIAHDDAFRIEHLSLHSVSA